MLADRLLIALLCAVGFYASVFMLRKGLLAARGALRESSVVETPRAKIFAGVPNALFGCLYYAGVAAAAWIPRSAGFLGAATAAAILAAAASAYLAYSLLRITRRSCPYCWAAHGVNWLLLPAVTVLFARALRG